MVNIIKEELPIEESLKRKLELICEFSKTTPTIINGNIGFAGERESESRSIWRCSLVG